MIDVCKAFLCSFLKEYLKRHKTVDRVIKHVIHPKKNILAPPNNDEMSFSFGILKICIIVIRPKCNV